MKLLGKIIRTIRIKWDLRKARNYFTNISKKPEENFEILKRNYLEPETSRLVLPLKHPHGSYFYYTEIAQGLEYLLEIRFTNLMVSRSKPPIYVLRYVKH